MPTEQWVSIYNDDVWLKVSYYQGMTAPEAREEFARSSGAEFEDLMGGEPGDPLTAIYPRSISSASFPWRTALPALTSFPGRSPLKPPRATASGWTPL